jgi:hypothetical protein
MSFTDDRLDKFEAKLDKLDEHLNSIDKTLIKQEAGLSEHILRTTFAEQRLEHIETDLKPIKVHVTRLQGVMQFIGILSVLISIIAGIFAIIGVLK